MKAVPIRAAGAMLAGLICVSAAATALVGMGHSAASASRGAVNDRDYHYGVAPRLGLALRVIAGAQASVDVNAQKYFLGRVANRSAGREP